MAAGRQLVTQFAEVLDDAVVDDGDTARAVAVGMGIEVAGAPVSGPARVTKSDSGPRRIAAESVLEHGDLAGPLLHEQIALVRDQGDAGRVVAAVFETPQPIQQDGACCSGPGVSDDSAHVSTSLPVSSTVAPTFHPTSVTGRLRRGLV